jgi:hypothetical protein
MVKEPETRETVIKEATCPISQSKGSKALGGKLRGDFADPDDRFVVNLKGMARLGGSRSNSRLARKKHALSLCASS